MSISGEAAAREAALQRARDATAAIDKRLNDLMAWLTDQEEYLKSCGPVADTYDGLVAQLGEHKVGFMTLTHVILSFRFILITFFHIPCSMTVFH